MCNFCPEKDTHFASLYVMTIFFLHWKLYLFTSLISFVCFAYSFTLFVKDKCRNDLKKQKEISQKYLFTSWHFIKFSFIYLKCYNIKIIKTAFQPTFATLQNATILWRVQRMGRCTRGTPSTAAASSPRSWTLSTRPFSRTGLYLISIYKRV